MPKEPTLLIAEDDDDAAFLLQRALKKAAISHSIHRVKDGEEVVEYLSGTGGYGDRGAFPFPQIVLLDLNMPKKNGFEAIEWIRKQPAFHSLAIDVLSGSIRKEDIARALGLGANLYLKKPLTFAELETLLTGYRQVLACRGLV